MSHLTVDKRVIDTHTMTPFELMTDPWHIVSVSDFSQETLQRIIAHLEVSTEFEHLVYREAELDAIWSITGFFLNSETDSDQRDLVERLHKAAHEAHDLVADGRAAEAATLLRGLLNHVVP